MKKRITLALVAVLLAFVVGGSMLFAQSTFAPNIVSWTTAGGGTIAGSTFSVNSAIGQPFAGQAASGGSFSVASGFLAGSSILSGQRVYLPMTVR